MCPSGRRRTEGNTRASPKPFIRSAFEILDFDKDGKISKEDLTKTFYAPSFIEQDHEEVIKTMMGVADLDKDGFVEYEEFERVVGGVPEEDGRRRVMEEAFRVMDKDGDGVVGFEDLKEFMGWAGFRVSEEDVVAMIRLASGMDREHERGVVTFDDLLRILGL